MRWRLPWGAVRNQPPSAPEPGGSPGPDRLVPEELLDPLFDEEFAAHRPFIQPALDEECSALVARYLYPTEKFRGEWRPHLIRPARAALFIALYATLTSTIAVRSWPDRPHGTAIAVIVALAALALLSQVAAWWFTRLVLTNKRLLLVRGVFTRRVSTVPLLRVVDIDYLQSTTGRLLDYGTFRITGAHWLTGMRKITELPNPNELYLRVIEEMYEPEAVEARLAEWTETLREEVPRSVSNAVRNALAGPDLVNYDGWVSITARDVDSDHDVLAGRELTVEPGHEYELAVFIGPELTSQFGERLMVTGGIDDDVVAFTVEIDSDRPALRVPAMPLIVSISEGAAGRRSTLTVDERYAPPPWLWIRVAQGMRTLQSIELAVRYADPRPGGRPLPR